MQFRFLLNSEQKIVAAKIILLQVYRIFYVFFYVIENSLFTDFGKRDYSPLDIHESGWKNNKDRLSANA